MQGQDANTVGKQGHNNKGISFAKQQVHREHDRFWFLWQCVVGMVKAPLIKLCVSSCGSGTSCSTAGVAANTQQMVVQD